MLASDFLPGAETILEGWSSQLGSAGLVTRLSLALPFTRALKSSSRLLFALGCVLVTPLNDMKSSLAADVELLALPESSCSFLSSLSFTCRDNCLIKVRNRFRFSSGLSLVLYRIGIISIATKSALAASPAIRSTLSAAVITTSSFV